MTVTFKLTVSYDGTRFAGWQRQKNGRTVQATLESALRQITGKSVRVTGAGRTDAGVHARGQVAHVQLATRLSRATLLRALHAILPEDIVVRHVQKAPPGFHARYWARAKWYRYTLWNHPTRPLLERAFVHHVPTTLDVSKMRQAARLLRGRHDFHPFHCAGRPVASTLRTLSRLSVRKQGGRILIEAVADGFLYRMVRRLVGLLIEVGRGRVDPRTVKDYFRQERVSQLAGRPVDRFKSKKHLTGKPANRRTGELMIPPTVPAKGLCLMRVWY